MNIDTAQKLLANGKLISLIILAPPYIQLPPHGPGSGAKSHLAKIASSSNNHNNHSNSQERPHHNEVTDLTNIPTSSEIDDNINPRNENQYTVRRDRPERRELLRARRRSSLSFPTQDSTLVSYGSYILTKSDL